ncbi:MAG: metal-dependent phosphohydrolase [Pseudomonadota bacterium]
MFDPNNIVIEAFVQHSLAEFHQLFPSPDVQQSRSLEQATRTALQTLLNCDCPYHDLQHTILVTEVGQTILKGRQTARGDLTAHDWLQGVVAMLFHDIGYLRTLLTRDTEQVSVVDEQGSRVTPPSGCTDAFMTPYHVTRGIMYVRERFANDPAIDIERVSACIEMTRFPVPHEGAYQQTDSLAGLVRAADLIGQMGDPQYLQKLSRLYAEFVETGEAERLGFDHAGALRSGFPEFFYAQVHPFIGAGITYLKRTWEGHQWIANLYHHLHMNQADDDVDPKVRAPELVVDNVT